MATVTRSPGAVVEGNIYGAGSYNWSDLNNLLASDNARATVLRSGMHLYPYTPILTEFGFTIPTGSTINAITVNIEGFKSKTGENTSRIDYVSLMSGGNPVLMHAFGALPEDFTPDMPLTEDDTIYAIQPGASAVWGRSWTPAEINSDTFGCAFDCMMNEDGMTIYVDHVSITIDYTEEAPPEDVCNTRDCNKGFENLEMAIKNAVAKDDATGCFGWKTFPVQPDCDNLTPLTECGDSFTLEQAFKAALIDDGCGGSSLRIFVLPADRGGVQ